MSYTKFAYVFLVMKGDSYIPGVICAAESIRISQSKLDIICMVTPDVSAGGREMLLTAVTRVVEVPYLSFNSHPMKTRRQMELYESWMADSYTKWNSLRLVEYEKIVFVDADILVLCNLDHLFELNAPAGTFSTPWAQEFEKQSVFNLNGYPSEHGATVPHTAIMKSLAHGGYTFIASVVMIAPNEDDFKSYCASVEQLQPFGFNNFSTPDEQSLAWFYANRGVDWTHIHQKYNFIVHKIKWILSQNGKLAIPQVLHYFSSKKPWLRNHDEAIVDSVWNTDKLWWYYFQHWARRTKKSLDIPRMQDAHVPIQIKWSAIDDTYFPWLKAYSNRFPRLFRQG